MTTSRKAIVIFSIAAIVVIVALMLTSGVASAATRVVNLTSPACTVGNFYYTSIQAAVWNASDGDTIIVCPGRYNETVTVNKSNIVIKAFNETKPIVSAVNNPDDHVFNIINQINVTLQGFEIRDAHGTSQSVAGIYMYNASECNISNNNVTNISATVFDASGIYLDGSSDNTFNSSTSVSNITSTDYADGIYLYQSSNNNFSGSTSVSTIHGHNADGIDLYQSSNNNFSGSTSVSTIHGHNAYGIYLHSSSNNNTFSASTSVSNITGNQEAYGIYLYWYSSNNRFNSSTSVSNVTANSHAFGIALWSSSSNRFSSSTSVSNVTANSGEAYGIRLRNSDSNTFNSSTSVSNIDGDNAFGIALFQGSSNNAFSSNTSVSNITATTSDAFGIYLGSSSTNRFSSSTSVSNVTGVDDACGICLEESDDNNVTGITIIDTLYSVNAESYGIWLGAADDNHVTGITIRPTLTGAGYYEFYSEADCDDNVVTDMTIGNPTTISFTYGNGIWIKRVETPEPDPSGKMNIVKYVNATNVTADSWIFLNVSYDPDDIIGVDESSLRLYRWNGTAWELLPPPNGVNTMEDYVYANITTFSQIAAFGNPSARVPALTPIGLIALISVLSTIAAITITRRKRR